MHAREQAGCGGSDPCVRPETGREGPGARDEPSGSSRVCREPAEVNEANEILVKTAAEKATGFVHLKRRNLSGICASHAESLRIAK